jgi:transposase
MKDEAKIANATYYISTGKIEEINNKTKTSRRQCYSYPGKDHYFPIAFKTKWKSYVKNPS